MDLLRKTAFFVSLLVSIIFLDASFRQLGPASTEEGSSAPTVTHLLSVQLEASAGGPPRPTFADARVSAARELGGNYQRPIELTGEGTHSTGRLAAGTYLLIVHAPGFARWAEHVVHDGETRVVAELEPAFARSVEVVVDKGGSLQPLAGVTVLLSRPGALPFGAKTDEAGLSHFAETPSGELDTTVYAPGYEPYRAVTTGDVLVRLRPVSALRVKVERKGESVPGATVWLSGLSLWPARAVQTGPKGYVDVTGLSASSYSVSAELGQDVSEEARVELPASAGTTEVTLELHPGFFVDARIHDASKRPIAEAQVSHTLVGLGARARRGETDLAGRVKLGPLPSLVGQLLVRAKGYLPEVVSVATSMPQEIELSQAGSVSGRVSDARGRAVAGATVEIVGTDINKMPVAMNQQLSSVGDAHFTWATGSQNVLLPAGELGVLLGPVPSIPLVGLDIAPGQKLTTDDRGQFNAIDVPPGRLIALVRHPDHLDGKSAPFDLSPGGHRDVSVVLGSGSPLVGRVLDHRDFPVPQARVSVIASGFERQLSAASDGTFSLGAAPEEVRLRVARADAPLTVLMEMPVRGDARAREVLMVLPEPRGQSELTCVDPSGQPVPLAQLTIVSNEPLIPLRMTRFTDRQGQATFDQAAGLSVRLQTAAPGFVDQSRALTLSAETKITLTPAISVSGRITAVRGRAVASGAKVRFSGEGVSREGIANALGEYELTDLPRGRGLLEASHPELGRASLSVQVASGPRQRSGTFPDLDLVPPASVRGQVVDAEGRGVAASLSLDRLSAYLAPGARSTVLGESDAEGRFELKLDATQARYLFAAELGRRFGFSAPLSEAQLEGREDVQVLLDRTDEAEPDVQATVLLSLEQRGQAIYVYAVAKGSSAERAGLRREARLLEIDGTQPKSVHQARALLSGKPGSDARVRFSQQGSTKTARLQREAFVR